VAEQVEDAVLQSRSGGGERKTLRMLSLTEFLAVLFNAVLALTAIIGSCYLYRQTRAMELQLKAMQDQLTDSRKAAAESDKATNRQIETWSRLVEANKTTAIAASASVAESAEIAVATQKLANATTTAAKAANSLATAAKEANAVSRELAATTQRAGAINAATQRAFVFASGVEFVTRGMDTPFSKALGQALKSRSRETCTCPMG